MKMFGKVDVGGGVSDFWAYVREPRPHRWAIWGVALALTGPREDGIRNSCPVVYLQFTRANLA